MKYSDKVFNCVCKTDCGATLVITGAEYQSERKLKYVNSLLGITETISDKSDIWVNVISLDAAKVIFFGGFSIELSKKDTNTVITFVQNYLPGEYRLITDLDIQTFAFPVEPVDQDDLLWLRCEHEIHQDSCVICAPYWGEYPVCPICGRKMRQTETHLKCRCGAQVKRTDNICAFCGKERSFMLDNGKPLGRACHVSKYGKETAHVPFSY